MAGVPTCRLCLSARQTIQEGGTAHAGAVFVCRAAFMSKTLVVDDQAIKFQIWDTAGQEKYHSLAPMYYRGASAAIVVYDITREVRLLPLSTVANALPAAMPLTCVPRMRVQPSFKTLQNWVQELQSLGPENIVIAIAGNKCDLDDKREVSRETAQTYADEINAIFVETSAKTGDNVQEMFTDISKRLPATTAAAGAGANVIIHDTGGQKKKCC